MSRPILFRAKFRAWLAGQPADAEVGRTYVCTDCPLARWLRERFDHATVAGRAYEACNAYARASWRSLPRWAQDFTWRVDHLYPAGPPTYGAYCGRAVTAAQALDILDSIPPAVRSRWYIGHLRGQAPACEAFRSAVAPSEASHGERYALVTGPYRNRVAAACAAAGHYATSYSSDQYRACADCQTQRA